MEKVKQVLHAAIETGEIIHIIYHGGSEPGATRMIAPLKVDDKIVMARCLTSSKVKGFSLSKIEISHSDQANFTGEHKEPVDPENVKMGIAPFVEELINLGWFVQLETDVIYLFAKLKSGKPKKNPSLFLAYYVDPNTDLPPQFIKPWKACGLTFKYFDRALQKFLIAARENAPNKNN